MKSNSDSPIRPEQFAALANLRRALVLEEGGERKAPAEYSFDLGKEAERISENVEVLASHYAQFLDPKKGKGPILQSGFEAVFLEVKAKLMESIEKNEDSRLYVAALSELRLLTEVDRMLSVGRFEHLQVVQVASHGTSNIIEANLSGVFLQEDIEAKSATWSFDPTGMRLDVKYWDSVKRQEIEIGARLDFHYLRRGRDLSERKEAAIDLEGKYLSPALKSLGMDRHRQNGSLDEAIENDQDFLKLSQRRFRGIEEMIAHNDS